MTNDNMSRKSAEVSKSELTEAQLDSASGGAPHSVTSPRDAASGLATGKRMYKPFILRQL